MIIGSGLLAKAFAHTVVSALKKERVLDVVKVVTSQYYGTEPIAQQVFETGNQECHCLY